MPDDDDDDDDGSSCHTHNIIIITGSIVTLCLDDHRKSFEDLDGVKCTPTCRSTNCVIWGSKSSCDCINYQFEIIIPEDPNVKKIKSGGKVALRSKNNPTQWLDCSNVRGVSCSITRCTGNNVTDSVYSTTTCNSYNVYVQDLWYWKANR